MVTCPTKCYAKMAEAHYKPIVYGISPGTSEDRRVSEFLNKHVAPYCAQRGLGFYRGGNPGELEDTLSRFVTDNCSYKGPLVITVNTHGIKSTGNFRDTATRGEIEVTPELLFKSYDEFQGLRKHVENYLNGAPQHKVYLVMAQCYGGEFAVALQKEVDKIDAALKDHIEVVGLSSDCTHSSHSSNPDATIGTEAIHVEFSKWLEKIFANAVDPRSAKQAPGVGAKMAEAHYKPIVYGISPGTSEDRRVSEFLNKHVAPYCAQRGLGFYRGGNPGELEDTLSRFVTDNCSYKGPLVITVNTHGIKSTGNFRDTATRGEIEVTPELLFKSYDEFQGLRKHVENYLNGAPQHKVYLVMAQCYGGEFAVALQKEVDKIDAALKDHIEVVGLSSDCTHSSHSSNPDATIGTEAIHVEFSKWLEKIFANAVDPRSAKQAPGVGAKMAEAHYKPIVYGISPGKSEDKRVSEFLNIEHMERYRAKGGVGIYRGGNPGELEDTLSSFVTRNSSYKGPLVITVNTHGLENTGNFCDTAAGTHGEIEVTPGLLFNGYNTFKGLRTHVEKYLQETPQRKVYLVMAQCYGGIFAVTLQIEIDKIDEIDAAHIEVVGLSFDCTYSTHSSNPDATIGTEARHDEFSEWMKGKFANAVDPRSAKQAPGTGAIIQLQSQNPAPGSYF